MEVPFAIRRCVGRGEKRSTKIVTEDVELTEVENDAF